MSNFNFQWTKTLYQNNLNNIVFFFTIFKGYSSLRSKRFRVVSEQRKTEERDSRFWPREK